MSVAPAFTVPERTMPPPSVSLATESDVLSAVTASTRTSGKSGTGRRLSDGAAPALSAPVTTTVANPSLKYSSSTPAPYG